MTHEEFLKAVQNERSFINRLLKSKAKREETIHKLIVERYKNLIGKFCYINDNYYYFINIEGRAEYDTVKPFAEVLSIMSIDSLFKGAYEPLGFAFKPYYLRYEEIQKAEQNIVSKEEVFNYIQSLLKEMESKF